MLPVVRIHLVSLPLRQPEHSLRVARMEKLSKSLAVAVELECQFSRQVKKHLPCPFLQQAQVTQAAFLQSIPPFFHPPRPSPLVNQCQGRPCLELLCLQAVEDSESTLRPEAMPFPQRLVETNPFQPQPQIREALFPPPPRLAATILSARHRLREELILFPLPPHRQAATILLVRLLQAEPIPFPRLLRPVEELIRLGHLLLPRPVEELIRFLRLLRQRPVE